jgi:hypothetical protein
MKDFFSGLVVIAVIGFIALALIGKVYCEANYRYRITVPDGKYSTSFYTDGYVKRNGCIRFRQGGMDSTEVCGMYTISQLR